MNPLISPRVDVLQDLPDPVIGRLVSWQAAFDAESGDAAHLLCDRWEPEHVAFRFVDADLEVTPLTFGELEVRSRQMAAVLAELGVARGDRVAVLMGKRPELVETLLAIWRLGAVHVPLFTAFAGEAIAMRLRSSDVKVAVTDSDQRPKIDALSHDVSPQVLEVGPELAARLGATGPYRGSVAVGGSGTLVHLYTSGTTGTPKAVPVPLRALTSICSYMVHGLDVAEGDILWNAADPGWAYGLYYAVLGPLATGRPNILAAGGFTAEGTRAVIDRFGVTNYASAPTVYRSLMQARVTLERPLRRASSAGEPLTPDVGEWAQNALAVEVRDHYGQTEQGMIIANAWHPDLSRPVAPGSMGQALPGFAATILDERIALEVSASPLMWFTGYVDAPEMTAERFTQDRAYYLTGDTGREVEGNYYFAARDDDIILMAGYRIGPTDIETVLNGHPAVVESAVVGRPDAVRGEVAVAFVVLADPEARTPELASELQQLVKTTYAAHAYPRAVHFIDVLPKTPSGKLQRSVLRQQTVD